MVYLLKFGASFFLPPGIFFVLFVVIAVFAYRRGERKIAKAILLVTLVFYALSTGIVGDALMRGIESRYSPPTEPHGDAIVMLGGGATKDTPDIDGVGMLTSSPSSRMLTAARLYRVTHLPIVLSGGQVYTDSGTEAVIGRRVLMGLGVDERDIFVETESINTTQNAEYTARILQGIGAKQPMLVTSAFHMPRAVLCFKNQGIDVVPYPTDFQANRETRDFHYNRLAPSADALLSSTIALRERLRLFVTEVTGK